MTPISLDDAPTGRVLLAWLGHADLPSYKLVSKSPKTGKWCFEESQKPLPAELIEKLWELPR